MSWLREARFALATGSGVLLLALILAATGVVPAVDQRTGPATEATLTADYIAFEALYTPLLDTQHLDQSYDRLTQSSAPFASTPPRRTSRGDIAAVQSAITTARSLGATRHLAPARDLYIQAYVDIARAWSTEQEAELAWRHGWFPVDVTGLTPGRGGRALIWYRDRSHTALGDGVRLVWFAHQMLLKVAATYRVAVPDAHLPMPPMPAFRGV